MDDSVAPIDALKKAIAVAGSQSALARILGTRQSTVSAWLLRGTPLPAERVLPIEEATGVSRHDLRPDLYPREESPAHPPATPPLPAGGSSASLERAQA
mgnify:CR=1 FL=1